VVQRVFSRKFSWAAVAQVVVAFAALGGWFVHRTQGYLAAPTDGDLYAHTWSYQALAFFMTYGAVAMLAVLVLICLEFIALNWLTCRREIGNRAP
jgi:hypothetical protein